MVVVVVVVVVGVVVFVVEAVVVFEVAAVVVVAIVELVVGVVSVVVVKDNATNDAVTPIATIPTKIPALINFDFIDIFPVNRWGHSSYMDSI